MTRQHPNPAPSGGLKPLEPKLPPVVAFQKDMLPESVADFVEDLSYRLQTSMDYAGVAVMSVLAGALGRKRRIRPKQLDDWECVPTMWAALVGEPSTYKSTVLSNALAPLKEIEKEMKSSHAYDLSLFNARKSLADHYTKQARENASSMYTDDPEAAAKLLQEATFEETMPTCRRCIVTDSTVEKLGEVMSSNPNGLLLSRDELAGFLSQISREDRQADRSFYLECFEGTSGYSWERITRKDVEIEQCVLSILGGIQPTKLRQLVEDAVEGKVDDGLIQRFQMAVWPDQRQEFEWIDQAPDERAQLRYEETVRHLYDLEVFPDDLEMEVLRFEPDAHVKFMHWLVLLQNRSTADNFTPLMRSHLAKLPKTIVGIALIIELADGGRDSVSMASLKRALAWSDYLISHAERIYTTSGPSVLSAANLIYTRRQMLASEFSHRDVQRSSWTGLRSHAQVNEAIEVLLDYGYVKPVVRQPGSKGGRPSTRYRWRA